MASGRGLRADIGANLGVDGGNHSAGTFTVCSSTDDIGVVGSYLDSRSCAEGLPGMEIGATGDGGGRGASIGPPEQHA
jgi:hypothetical protein